MSLLYSPLGLSPVVSGLSPPGIGVVDDCADQDQAQNDSWEVMGNSLKKSEIGRKAASFLQQLTPTCSAASPSLPHMNT